MYRTYLRGMYFNSKNIRVQRNWKPDNSFNYGIWLDILQEYVLRSSIRILHSVYVTID